MEKKIFNPLDWLEQPVQQQINTEPQKVEANTDAAEVEQIIQQIEAKQIDIATAYSDWRDIGFAFADAFGETGREYFHRISKFYADYSATECDTQYTNCLKANGHGVTLKTFFFHAKQAGVNIAVSPQYTEQEKVQLPTFPESIYPQLPEFLQKVVKIASFNEERDILLLGTIVSLSACFQKLYGIYDGKKVFSNLYIFITAQASAGKGRLAHCKQLVKPIHKHLREQAKLMKQQHELEMMEYNEKKGKDASAEKPNKPPEKMLFIPANNSTTGVFQLLFDNEGRGLMFETEGDTLAQAFKTDYGNYSDGFRKAFHHETISYYRRTDREYVDIERTSQMADSTRSVKTILSELRDINKEKRRSAVMKLGMIGGEEASRALIRTLENEHEDLIVRGRAALMLGKLGDTTAVSALIRALSAPGYQTPLYAAQALGMIGDQRAVLPLVAMANTHTDRLHDIAVEALRKLDYIWQSEVQTSDNADGAQLAPETI